MIRLSLHYMDGTENVIIESNEATDIDNAVNKYFSDNNIKPYYMRHWVKDDRLWTDYGSHTCFIVVDEY